MCESFDEVMLEETSRVQAIDIGERDAPAGKGRRENGSPSNDEKNARPESGRLEANLLH